MSNLSELSKRLRELQSQNTSQHSEIDRLSRQVRILSDLQGISVHDLKDALKTACEGEAHNELRAEVGKLKAQLECFNATAGRSPNRARVKFGGGGENENRDDIKLKTQEQFDREAAARAQTNLELRIGELEELEGTLRAELETLFEKAQQLTAKNTLLETQHLQQQNLITQWERRWNERDEEDIRKSSIVAKTMPSGSYNYSEFATGGGAANNPTPQPTMLLHNEPQSQIDVQQKLLAAEAALAGEKQQKDLLQQQIHSAQKASDLKLEQCQHRILFQDGQINDLEQQLSSLYAAFGIVQQERVEERDQKLWLKRNLLESDAALAKEAEDKERGDNTKNSSEGLFDLPSYNISNPLESPSRSSVQPSATSTKIVAKGYLLLILPETVVSSPAFTKTKSDRHSPFSPRKLLAKTMSSPNRIGSTSPRFVKQYCVLHGSNGLYQIRYGNALLDSVIGVHEFITTGVSSIEHTNRSATMNYGFEIMINPEDPDSPSLCCAAETEEDFMMWMAALMGVIDGSFDDEGHVPPPEAFRNTV